MTEAKDVFAQNEALRAQCSILRTRFNEITSQTITMNRRADHNLASVAYHLTLTKVLENPFYHRLESIVCRMQQELASDEELQLSYAGPADEIIIVLSIGYQGTDLILLYGEDEEGQATTVILEANTVALVMKNVKIPYQFERRSIGFRGDLEQQSLKTDPWQLGPPPIQSP